MCSKYKINNHEIINTINYVIEHLYDNLNSNINLPHEQIDKIVYDIINKVLANMAVTKMKEVNRFIVCDSAMKFLEDYYKTKINNVFGSLNTNKQQNQISTKAFKI